MEGENLNAKKKNQKANWQSVPPNFRNRKQFFCTLGADEVGEVSIIYQVPDI